VARASQPTLSVVVPVYRCDDCLHALYSRLVPALETITENYEIIFIDDRSPDGAWATLTQLAAQDQRVHAVRFSRNFGQQAAITAGLARSSGRWTVVMDCDLQDPPEVIPKLYAKAREGYDIVLARRTGRQHSRRRRVLARLYQRFLKTFIGVEISRDYGAFSIISDKTRRAFLAIQDSDRHYIPILHWLGFERTDIVFDHAERYAGTSAYSFGQLLRLATQGVFFQTTTLLRWIVYAGFLIALSGAALAAFFIASYLFFSPATPVGWTSLAVLVLLIGGFIIASTGVTGLYIGKIFSQVKGRPLFIVDEEARDPVAAPVEAGGVQDKPLEHRR
jgi:glycosyltransferase involved in cell wall biosynthesis